MKIATFAEIADEFLERVNKAVWCNVATIDTKGRPRSRGERGTRLPVR